MKPKLLTAPAPGAATPDAVELSADDQAILDGFGKRYQERDKQLTMLRALVQQSETSLGQLHLQLTGMIQFALQQRGLDSEAYVFDISPEGAVTIRLNSPPA